MNIVSKYLVPAASSVVLALFSGCSDNGESGAPPADSDQTLEKKCGTFESYVGADKVNVVDFTATTGGADSPFKFRLKFDSFESVPSDGYFGALTRGKMTFSYPRQANPELPYVKSDPYPAPYVHGPAFGETVAYQVREIACKVFEIHWKEPRKGDTVTHVQDFGRNQVCTNITNINRAPIPTGFDPFDLQNQLNNRELFPDGSPLDDPNFGFFPLCGTMSQSRESEQVWEKMNCLVYTTK